MAAAAAVEPGMTSGRESRNADHSVEPLFLDRWSPRAFSGELLSPEELTSLFEAARWAPSSYNNQPWRILYATRGGPEWDRFFNLLIEANRVWVARAAVLLLFLSKKTFDHNGKPCITHSFDCGAAWENLALQAAAMNLVAHGMQGFDYERARTELRVPEGFQIEAMAALGRPGRKEDLPPALQEREVPSGRRPLSETVREGPFSFSL